LPFIIVAAAALLLLPILSRDNATELDGNGAHGSTYPDFVATDTLGGEPVNTGIGANLAPSTGRNPLDYILKLGGADAPSDTRDSIDPSEYMGEPAVISNTTVERPVTVRDSYAPAARGGIRNAITRKATALNALRNSKIALGGANTGASKTLAFGSAPASTPSHSYRAGVRPVALQPLASAGRGGRSLTGEGLYAEAARSIGAMNVGPAHKSLADAQLRDVDGAPLGAAGGSGMAGATIKSVAAGAPKNTNSYKPKTPWWWDFEKQKYMKQWELWDYNFQKAASDAIIKVGTNLALCLATGSEDGSVKNFLGKLPGDTDYKCGGYYASDMKQYAESKSGSGDNQTTSSDVLKYMTEFCKEQNLGVPVPVDGKARTWYDVRTRCLGMKWSDLKAAFKATYTEADNCANVNSTPMQFNFSSSWTKDHADNLGVYVLGKCKNNPDAHEQVIYIQGGGEKGGELNGKAVEEIAENKGFIITKVGGFIASASNFENKALEEARIRYQRLEGMSTEEIRKEYMGANDLYADDLSTLKKRYDKLKAEADSEGVFSKFSSIQNRIKNINCDRIPSHTLVRAAQDPSYIEEGYIESAFKVRKTCPVDEMASEVKIEPVQLAEGQHNQDASFVDCGLDNDGAKNLNPLDYYTFRIKAENVDKDAKKTLNKVNAFMVEHIQSFDKEGNPTLPKVKYVWQDVQLKNGYYTVSAKVGVSDTTTSIKQDNAIPGTGKIFWVVSDSAGIQPGVEHATFPTMTIASSQLVKSTNAKMAVCEYAWGCNAGGCKPNDQPKGNYCKDVDANGNKKAYAAVSDGNGYYKKTLQSLGGVDLENAKKDILVARYKTGCADCTDDFFKEIPTCMKLCKNDRDNTLSILDNKDNTINTLSRSVFEDLGISDAVLSACESCNREGGLFCKVGNKVYEGIMINDTLLKKNANNGNSISDEELKGRINGDVDSYKSKIQECQQLCEDPNSRGTFYLYENKTKNESKGFQLRDLENQVHSSVYSKPYCVDCPGKPEPAPTPNNQTYDSFSGRDDKPCEFKIEGKGNGFKTDEYENFENPEKVKIYIQEQVAKTFPGCLENRSGIININVEGKTDYTAGKPYKTDTNNEDYAKDYNKVLARGRATTGAIALQKAIVDSGIVDKKHVVIVLDGDNGNPPTAGKQTLTGVPKYVKETTIKEIPTLNLEEVQRLEEEVKNKLNEVNNNFTALLRLIPDEGQREEIKGAAGKFEKARQTYFDNKKGDSSLQKTLQEARNELYGVLDRNFPQEELQRQAYKDNYDKFRELDRKSMFLMEDLQKAQKENILIVIHIVAVGIAEEEGNSAEYIKDNKVENKNDHLLSFRRIDVKIVK
jgi:hypothetical protein